MSAVLRPGADVIARDALLGVQFRDAVGGGVVAQGLEVTIEDRWRPAAQPGRTRGLVANRSGVFALHAFAGQRGCAGEALDSPPATDRFRITVRDRLARFVPMAFMVTLPSDGLVALAGGGSPQALPPHVPLYSAATRELPVGLAALRAELRAAGDDGRALPWALLELWLGSSLLGRTVADAAGRALLAFPWPRPPRPALRTSPASAPPRPPAAEWPVTLRAFVDTAFEPTAVPDAEAVFAQPERPLVEGASPFTPLAPLVLRGGQTLVVHSPPSSYLYVAV